MGPCLILSFLVFIHTVGAINSERNYECVDSEPIPVLLEGPHHSIVLESKSYPSFPNDTSSSSSSSCTWKVQALHGAQVRVTVLEVELDKDCLSTSYLSLTDESDEPSRLHFPSGVEARCNQPSTIPASTDCLTSVGILTITSTPGLKHRLLLEATPPPECPQEEAEDYCPEGPCCEDEVDCYCQYFVGSEPLELKPTKPGTCTYNLMGAAGSQISVNFLDIEMPPQDPTQGCEAYVTLEEEEETLGSIIGLSSRKFCGHTVPNYPGPSIFTGALDAGLGEMYIKYYLPATAIAKGQGFTVAVTAVNPLCSQQAYTHQYGVNVCEASCGPDEDLPAGLQMKDPCPSDICEDCDPPHCLVPPKKILLLTLIQTGTDTPVTGAQVNISSTSSFFPHHSDEVGEVKQIVVSNIAGLHASVAAEGFLSQEQVIQPDCENVECQDCTVSLTLFIDILPEVIEPCPEDMSYTLTILDSANRVVPGVAVSLSLVVDDEGEDSTSHLDILVKGIVTNEVGMVIAPITVDGRYKVNLTKEDWHSQELEFEVSDCTSAAQEVVLERDEPCQGTLSVHIRDPSDQEISGAEVSVFLAGQEIALDFSPLTADVNGQVSHVMAPEMVRISITAANFFPKETNANVTCESGLLIVILDPVPPTPAPTCFDTNADPIMFLVNVYDDLTGDRVLNAQGNISIEANDEAFQTANNALLGNNWGIQVEGNGVYEVTVSAEGYQTSSSSLEIACDPNDCASCSPSMSVYLPQELCPGNKDRILRVQVRDSITAAPMPAASVTVDLKVSVEASRANIGRQPISPHQICSALAGGVPCHGNISTTWPGGNRESCISRQCCYNDETGECTKPESDSGIKTDANGLVAVSLPGRGSYIVKVTKDNFLPQEFETEFKMCDIETLELAMSQEPLCSTGGLPLEIHVSDSLTGMPIPETNIQLVLTSSALGPSQVEVGGTLITDTSGIVSPIIYINGTYRISASAPGYQDLTHETEMDASVCDNGISVTLELTENPGPGCDISTGIDITVFDKYTRAPVSGVLLDVTNENDTSLTVAEGVRTDDQGEARVPVSKLGQYVATLNVASIPPYSPAANMTNLTCCSCPANIVLYLDQPHCNPLLTVTVRDNTTGLAITGSRVTVLLTHSLSGPSLTMEGSVMTTNVNGVSTINPVINGNYSVKVEAEQYLPIELPLYLECDPMDCNECSLDLNVDLAEDFCANKTLKLLVKDSTDNSPLEGAQVTFAMETYRGPWFIGSYTANSEGEVMLPLIGNGHFTSTIVMEGFLNMTSTHRVSATPEQCQFLAPMSVVPLSAPLEMGCVRVSLIWGEQPADLDLYSYRVNQYQSEEQCLTYYCDGKDPCDGITFDKDNKLGGEAGAETITYCDSTAYSNMIWVDDRSGLGASLLNSEAKLLITADSGATEEIILRPEEDTGARYWLAGCLTTTWSSFDFLILNQFTNGQPNLEQPLHCNSRTNLKKNPSKNAEINVTVSTIQGLSIGGAMVTIKTETETYNKLTDKDGQLNLIVSEDGEYSLLVELLDYIPERVNFSLSCTGAEAHCGTTVQVTMLNLEPEGAMRIKMNWAGDAGRDLDLHLSQVGSVAPREICQTYWNNMAGCTDTVLDHNMGASEGTDDVVLTHPEIPLAETIRIFDFAAKADLTYLVFADDNTPSGANFSLVEPMLTLTEGNTVVSTQMSDGFPDMDFQNDYYDMTGRYWVAGCLQAVGTSFRFVAQEQSQRMSIENPNLKAGIICDNLLGRVTPTLKPSFCEGVNLMLRVRDTQTDLALVGNVTATVLRMEGESEEMVWGGTVPPIQGEVAVPISQGGHYMIKVEGEGYIPDRQELDVSCSVTDCAACAPAVLVPMSPSMEQDELRLVLGGVNHLDNLDMYAVYRESNYSCVTIPGVEEQNPKSKMASLPNCPGVDHVAGNKGVETITFKRPSGDNPAVYTVFVKWTLPLGQEDTATFPNTNAWVSLTDGTVTEDIYMDAREYGAERHWVAGCLKVGGQNAKLAFEMKSLNVFFTERPDDEVPDLCLETFGLKAKGLKWEGQCIKDGVSRVLPYLAGTTNDNNPENCKDRCYEKGYTYSGVQYGRQCFCGNLPPSPDDIVDEDDCKMACSGDSSQICGAGYRMNVYDTGFIACDCEYKYLGMWKGKGCTISLAPPAGYSCDCTYTGWGFGCSGKARQCNTAEECPKDCLSKNCCTTGGGDCGGYP